jgi:hypothetical protein
LFQTYDYWWDSQARQNAQPAVANESYCAGIFRSWKRLAKLGSFHAKPAARQLLWESAGIGVFGDIWRSSFMMSKISQITVLERR